MAQQVLFADIEAVLVTAIKAGLTTAGVTAQVGTVVPNPRPAKLVRVERLGGTRRTVIVDQALVTVEAWAASHADAWDLCNRARAIVFSLEGAKSGTTMIYDIAEMAGPGNLSDPESDTCRFVWTAQIASRGTVAA